MRLPLLLLAAGLLGAAPPPAPLAEVGTEALAGVRGRIDHFAVDPSGHRLFVAALGNRTLEVLDVADGRHLASLDGLDEPQGVAFLPSIHRIAVATRTGGSVTSFDDATYQEVTTIANLPDADNLRFDAAANLLYVGHGDGALGVLDPATLRLVADIALPGHPESFRLEAGGPRIFVNVPTTHEIVVVDRAARAIVEHVPLPGFADNYPMALDDAGHRLFVGARHPARLLVFDASTSTLRRVAAVPCVGDTDDLFYDARRDRVYVIGGEGYVDVFDAGPNAHYARVAHLATRAGARTGLWSGELDRLFVGWPLRGDRPARIEVLAAPAAP